MDNSPRIINKNTLLIVDRLQTENFRKLFAVGEKGARKPGAWAKEEARCKQKLGDRKDLFPYINPKSRESTEGCVTRTQVMLISEGLVPKSSEYKIAKDVMVQLVINNRPDVVIWLLQTPAYNKKFKDIDPKQIIADLKNGASKFPDYFNANIILAAFDEVEYVGHEQQPKMNQTQLADIVSKVVSEVKTTPPPVIKSAQSEGSEVVQVKIITQEDNARALGDARKKLKDAVKSEDQLQTLHPKESNNIKRLEESIMELGGLNESAVSMYVYRFENVLRDKKFNKSELENLLGSTIFDKIIESPKGEALTNLVQLVVERAGINKENSSIRSVALSLLEQISITKSHSKIDQPEVIRNALDLIMVYDNIPQEKIGFSNVLKLPRIIDENRRFDNQNLVEELIDISKLKSNESCVPVFNEVQYFLARVHFAENPQKKIEFFHEFNVRLKNLGYEVSRLRLGEYKLIKISSQTQPEVKESTVRILQEPPEPQEQSEKPNKLKPQDEILSVQAELRRPTTSLSVQRDLVIKAYQEFAQLPGTTVDEDIAIALTSVQGMNESDLGKSRVFKNLLSRAQNLQIPEEKAKSVIEKPKPNQDTDRDRNLESFRKTLEILTTHKVLGQEAADLRAEGVRVINLEIARTLNLEPGQVTILERNINNFSIDLMSLTVNRLDPSAVVNLNIAEKNLRENFDSLLTRIRDRKFIENSQSLTYESLVGGLYKELGVDLKPTVKQQMEKRTEEIQHELSALSEEPKIKNETKAGIDQLITDYEKAIASIESTPIEILNMELKILEKYNDYYSILPTDNANRLLKMAEEDKNTFLELYGYSQLREVIGKITMEHVRRADINDGGTAYTDNLIQSKFAERNKNKTPGDEVFQEMNSDITNRVLYNPDMNQPYYEKFRQQYEVVAPEILEIPAEEFKRDSIKYSSFELATANYMAWRKNIVQLKVETKHKQMEGSLAVIKVSLEDLGYKGKITAEDFVERYWLTIYRLSRDRMASVEEVNDLLRQKAALEAEQNEIIKEKKNVVPRK